MKKLNNLIGCSTYLVSDAPNNRYTFFGLVECNDDLLDELKRGTEVELQDVDARILQTFRDNDVDLNDYTHCIIVGDEYYLSWE